MTPTPLATEDTKRVSCSQCHRPRWFPRGHPIPDPFVCALCGQSNEIAEGLRRASASPRPAA